MIRRFGPRLVAPALLVAAGFTLSSCDIPRAFGDANALIVAADPGIWPEAEETFRDAMEPTIHTVRDERPFRITYQDPTVGEDWGNLRRFREVLVMGRPEDFWVAEALELFDGDAPPEAPTILQVENVWARGQTVSVLLLPPGDPYPAIAQLAPALHELLDGQFRAYALTRMFASGWNETLADSLFTNVGFSLTIPQVYRMEVRGDSLYRFRNDFPSPQELIREIWVTWESPMPDSLPSAGELGSWHSDLALSEFNDGQVLDSTMVSESSQVTVEGLAGVEFQGAWQNAPGGWPAGGPLIVRALRCPSQDRLYKMDAWLYAPGRDKYEYMIQLETILESFRCR